MQYVTPMLWVLGLVFLTLAWLGIIMSLSMLAGGVLRRVGHVEDMGLDSGKRRLGVWGHGLVAGVIGYAVIVVFYVVLNLLQSRNPFFTPNALGRSLLGFSAPGEGVDMAALLVYNGLHLVVFLALGLGAAWLLLESGRHPKIWYLAFVLVLAFFMHLVGVVVVLAAPAGEAVPPWSVVTASLTAALAMAIYLLLSEPRILEKIRRVDLEA